MHYESHVSLLLSETCDPWATDLTFNSLLLVQDCADTQMSLTSTTTYAAPVTLPPVEHKMGYQPRSTDKRSCGVCRREHSQDLGVYDVSAFRRVESKDFRLQGLGQVDNCLYEPTLRQTFRRLRHP